MSLCLALRIRQRSRRKSTYPRINVSVKQEIGEGKVSVTVDGNTGMTHLVGSVLIGGEEVSIIQYGPRVSGGGG